MAIFNLFNKRNKTKTPKEPQKKSVNPYIDSKLNSKSASYAGVDVNYSTAMRQADVYTCVKIISESIGMIPLKVYREREGVMEEVSRGTRENKIFCQTPNDYMSSQELVEHLASILLLRGHAFLDVQTNALGNVKSLLPMRHLGSVNLSRNSSGVPFANWVTNSGVSKTSYPPFHKDGLFDIKLQSLDGYTGISPIGMMGEQIGTGIATQRHNAKIFENGTRLSGVLSTDDTLDDDSIDRIAESWQGAYGGTDNAGKVAVLEGGLQYTNITMTNHDAQLLELLCFSREQIAAAFRVPVHMLNDTTAQTMNNVEQNNLQFLKASLMPTMIKMENAFTKLLPDNMEIKFDTKSFVRGDIKTQAEVAEVMIKNRIISHEESRVMFDMSPSNPEHTFVISSNNYVWGNAKSAEEQSRLALEATRAAIDASKKPKEDPKEDPKKGEDEDAKTA
jgi:HK97 family phage portal protein